MTDRRSFRDSLPLMKEEGMEKRGTYVPEGLKEQGEAKSKNAKTVKKAWAIESLRRESFTASHYCLR